MSRIFVTLAIINTLALLVSVVLGLGFMVERDSGVVAPTGQQTLSWGWFATHMVVGLFTAVFGLFVHCLIFTYFLGTGRWVKEVARAYQLPDQLLPKQTREFKRQVFPPALFAMLSVIAAVATGAGAQTGPESFWGLAHPVMAMVALALNGWAYVIEYRTVTANARVIDAVMAEVEKRQAERNEEKG
jgi:hypothetical protein